MILEVQSELKSVHMGHQTFIPYHSFLDEDPPKNKSSSFIHI